MMKTKKSFGVALCREKTGSGSNGYEILLVNKKITYAYSNFVHGRYVYSDSAHTRPRKQTIKEGGRRTVVYTETPMDQFNKMTVDEKMTILSLNFDQIWGRIFLDKRFQQYYAARSKFDSLISDGGIKLKRMIEESTNGRELWEIPKGRKNTNSETNLECALRELYEETRVRYDQPVEGVVAASITTPTETITVEPRPFKLYPNITFTESYVDCGVIYTTVYYLAIATAPIKTAIKVSYGDQSCEIKDVQWMDLDKIKLLDGDSTINERLTRITKRILTVAKKTTAA